MSEIIWPAEHRIFAVWFFTESFLTSGIEERLAEKVWLHYFVNSLFSLFICPNCGLA